MPTPPPSITAAHVAAPGSPTVCVPTGTTSCGGKLDRYELIGVVKEVAFTGGTKCAVNKGSVRPPHWKEGVDVKDPRGGSTKPFVSTFKSVSTVVAEVTIEITASKSVSSTGRLRGFLGSLEFSCDKCPTSVGVHAKVPCKLTNPPDQVTHLRGDVAWVISETNHSAHISLKNSTRLELFVVLDTPAAYYKEGVWKEALVFVCDKAGAVGKKQPAEVVKMITQYCFSGHGLKYDTSFGAPGFGSGGYGGSMELWNYIDPNKLKINKIVNCYDQAAGVQVLAGAMGIVVTWIFMQPFGYIKQTTLVGGTVCNNPFFTGAMNPALVARDDPARTDFVNHAFVELGKIFDACAGPHLGTESRAEYVANSIDADPAIPRLKAAAGTTADMHITSGIASVS